MRPCVAWGLLLVVSICGAPFQAWGAEQRRKYDNGPLTAADFAASPDAASQRQAHTSTELRYEYRYKAFSEGGTIVAVLESISLLADVRPDQSWNKRPQDKSLLDHEQGHADIAYIECLNARIKFHSLQADPKFQGRGMTKNDAVSNLDKLIQKNVDAFLRAMRDADAEYDRLTAHGLNAKQAELRRVQQETIKRRQADWAKLEMAGSRKP